MSNSSKIYSREKLKTQQRGAWNTKFLRNVIKLYKIVVIVNRTNSKVYEPFRAFPFA